MAYFSAENSKKYRELLKKEFPKCFISAKIQNYSTVVVTLYRADFEIKGEIGEELNTRGCVTLSRYMGKDRFKDNPKLYEMFTKSLEILEQVSPYYDRSDYMSDYHDCAYYFQFQIIKKAK